MERKQIQLRKMMANPLHREAGGYKGQDAQGWTTERKQC